MIRIGVDLMGSENSPQALFDAVIQAYNHLGTSCHFHVFITMEAWKSLPPCSEKIIFHFVEEVIEMSDEPLSAVRHKKNSSLVTGINFLKKKKIDAFISLGNTGALVASAALTLPLLPGVKRPALLATLPAINGHISILDVGGSISSKADQLLSFALMGACFESIHFGVKDPKVGLLNVGAESKKGSMEHRLAHELLMQSKVQFIGNIEGFEVFQGKADVIVTDGFTGNVLLKTAEGLAAYIIELLKMTNTSHSELELRFSSDKYPGAILLGVEGLVMKCHGGSSSDALFHAIQGASVYIKEGLIDKIKLELERAF